MLSPTERKEALTFDYDRAKALVEMRLPALVLPDLRLASDEVRERLFAFVRMNGQISRAQNARDVAVIIFGSHAQQHVPQLPVEDASYAMSQLFRDIVLQLRRELRDFWQACIHLKYRAIGRPFDDLAPDAAALRLVGYQREHLNNAVPIAQWDAMTLARHQRAYEARLLYWMAWRVMTMLFEDDPFILEQMREAIVHRHSDAGISLHMRTIPEDQYLGVTARELHRRGLLVSEDGDLHAVTRAQLDPANAYRCVRAGSNIPHGVERLIGLPRFDVRGQVEGEQYRVLIETRVKTYLRMWAKWVMRGRSSTDFVPDLLGIRLIVLNPGDRARVSDLCSQMLDAEHGLVLATRPGIEVPVTPRNQHASPEFLATVHHTRIDGIRTEVQVLDLATWASVKFSLGSERDERYRMRRNWPLLNVWRPWELWRVQWNSYVIFRRNWWYHMTPAMRDLSRAA